jgi:type II secretory pathway predicted ATPase ExeA
MSIDRLRAHFGFERTPFTKELAPGMLHQHQGHAQAVARICWCITEQALGMVTGEVGSGKTVAVRAAVATLDPSRHTVIYLGCPAIIGPRGIYTAITLRLGIHPPFHYASLVPAAQQALEAERQERGRRVLLVVDEAHLLGPSALEELRMLTSAEMDSRQALCLVLVGQPTLRRRVKQGAFAALDQRIALRYTMAPMSAEETASYIEHHLKLAGRSDRLFSDDAVGLIHEVSRGLPRQVNNLATQALIATYAAGKSIADEQAARQAVAEVEAE